MKKARKVDLKEGQILSKQEFTKLHTHARNSALWYVMNSSKTLHEIKEKLYDKGYPRDTIFWVTEDGEKTEVDIVEDIANFLVTNLFVDDEDFALRYAQSRKRNGFGESRVKRDLYFKGVDQNFIDNAIREVYGLGDNEELVAYLNKEFRLMSRREVNSFKLKSRLISKAMNKGWPMSEISVELEKIFDQNIE